MSRPLAYLDGQLVGAGAEVLATEARRLAEADGLFETMLVHHGRVRDLAAHLERLRASAVAEPGLALEPALGAALEAVAASARAPRGRLRVTVTSGSGQGVVATCAPYTSPALLAGADIRATLLDAPVVARNDPARQHKSLSWRRQAATLMIPHADCFDALLLNDDGAIAEGLRSNVVVRIHGQATTPALSAGCLPGTVRRRLLESGAVVEGMIRPEALLSGQEVVMTNSLVGVVPVAAIDGQPCATGTMATDLKTAWKGTLP